MDTLANDVRYAIRSLRKAAGVTTVAVVVLALGIGVNAAIFSVVDAVLLGPLPYPDADRIVTVGESSLTNREQESVAAANYLDWKAQSRSFDALAAYRSQFFNVSGDGEPERVTGTVVAADYFRVLGVGAALGRTIAPDEAGGHARVAVLSDGFWKRRYGGSPDVVGREIALNGESYTVVGVMPAEFAFPGRVQLWASSRYAAPDNPLNPAEDPSPSRDHQYMDVVGRLAPGVSVEQAQADLDVVARRLAAAYPDTNDGRGAYVVGLREWLVGDTRPVLLMLLGAVGFVLLIACANVANLLVVRAAARRKEMATRAALGASRWRLARQLLVESVVLSLAGGAAGLMLATWCVRPLASLAQSDLPGGVEPALDWRVLAFGLGVSALTGVVFGLLPALQVSQVDMNDALKESARGSTGGVQHNRVRSALAIFEIAVSLVLLVGAGLMVKSLGRLQNVDPGFDARDLVTAQVSVPAVKYPDPDRKAALFARVIERVRAIPGVRSAGATTRLPMTNGNSDRSFAIEGRPATSFVDSPLANYRAVSADYFRTMGIPVLGGRDLAERDTKEAPRVAVINEALAAKYFPGENAVGKRIGIVGDGNFMEIVGVVGNVRHANLVAPPRPEIDVPFEQDPWPFMTIVVRTEAPLSAVAGALREAVREVDPDQPVADVATMEQLLERSVGARRFNTSLLGFFAGMALLLASIGIYGVVSYSVAQRVHEIGIRMALGAERRDVFRLVVGHGLALAAGGVAAGLVAALALTRAISGLLFGVSPTDPIVFAAVTALLAGAAVLASVVPARRATRVDPMVALRCE